MPAAGAPMYDGYLMAPDTPKRESQRFASPEAGAYRPPRPFDPEAFEAALDAVATNLIRSRDAVKRLLPDVATEVIGLLPHQHTDAARIERSIARDPRMGEQLVSLANSPLFSVRSPVRRVRDAVVRVGLDNVRDLLMVVVTHLKMFAIGGFETHVACLRRRSLATALIARALAARMRVHPEAAFLAGLLHDVGHLILLQAAVNERVVTPAMAHDPHAFPTLLGRLELHHQAIGAAACQIWRLPSGVVDAAFCHHAHKYDGRVHVAAALVALSDLTVETMSAAGGVPLRPPFPTREDVARDLELSREDLAVATAQATAQVEALEASRALSM